MDPITYINNDTITYNIIKKEFGIITFERNGLSFDDAYELATPDYTKTNCSNNNWHVMLKYAVTKSFMQINNQLDMPNWLKLVNVSVSDKDKENKTITVSYETKEQYSNIKIREYILEQVSSP